MRAIPTIAAAIGLMLPMLSSCAASGSSAKLESSAKQVVNLTNATGNVRLLVPAGGIAPFELHAFGDALTDSPFLRGSTDSAAWLRIGKDRFPILDANQPAPSTMLRSNDWQYLRIDSGTASSGVLHSARRHMLIVEPDLVIVLDELRLTNSASVEIQLPTVRPLYHDTLRDEWTVNSEHAGLVARFLSAPKSVQLWTAPSTISAGHGATNASEGSVTSLIAESSPECFHLTILVTHPKQSRPSLGFKLLESDTAIGARIHRDGLPTLVAFRKASCAGEANLTGLKFTAPVAVDVFRPKRRK